MVSHSVTHRKGVIMSGREKDRKLRRRRNRRKKIRKLKRQLEEAKTVLEREKIMDKILRLGRYIPAKWLKQNE